MLITAVTYPQIVGSFAQGYPGFARRQMSPVEGDRRFAVFSTNPVGSFADGYPLPEKDDD